MPVQSQLLQKRFYQMLLEEIDDDSKAQLLQYDQEIKELTDLFHQNGWRVSRLFIAKPLSQGISCRLERDLDGYHICPLPPQSLTLSRVKEEELLLLANYSPELRRLHKAFLGKDDILFSRKYILKNSDHADKVEDMRTLLGFNNPETTILTDQKYQKDVSELDDQQLEELSRYFQLTPFFDELTLLPEEMQEYDHIRTHNPIASIIEEYKYLAILNAIDTQDYKDIELAYFEALRVIRQNRRAFKKD